MRDGREHVSSHPDIGNDVPIMVDEDAEDSDDLDCDPGDRSDFDFYYGE